MKNFVFVEYIVKNVYVYLRFLKALYYTNSIVSINLNTSTDMFSILVASKLQTYPNRSAHNWGSWFYWIDNEVNDFHLVRNEYKFSINVFIVI